MDTMLAAYKEYMIERAGLGAAENTLRNVEWALKPFVRHVDGLRIPPALLDRKTIKSYLYGEGGLSTSTTIRRGLDGERAPLSPVSFNNAQMCISALMRWGAAEDYFPAGLHVVCRPIPVPRVEQQRCRSDQLLEAIEQCTDPRDKMYLSLATYTLGRAGELQLVRWDHVDFRDTCIRWWNQKKKRFDTKEIDAYLATDLREWKFTLEGYMGETVHPEWCVLPTRFTHPISRKVTYTPLTPLANMELIAHKYLDCYFTNTAGIGSHTLRRSAARALFDHLCSSGYDGALRHVSALLDHKSTVTTERYLGLDEDKMAIRRIIREGRANFLQRGMTPVTELRRRAIG